MTSSRWASDLAAVLVPVGVAGAVLATLCALLAGIAIVRGADGLVGGAVGVWIPGAMLSLFASFSSQWTPALVSVGALIVGLTAGAAVRTYLRGAPVRAERRAAARAAATGVGVDGAAVATSPAATAVVADGAAVATSAAATAAADQDGAGAATAASSPVRPSAPAKSAGPSSRPAVTTGAVPTLARSKSARAA